MENRFQTSFIPKRPIVSGGSQFIKPKGPPSFFIIIGVVVFLITMGVFGGLYFYKKSLTTANEAKKQQIQTAIKNFEPELTRQLTVLKTRVDSSKQLLGNHIAVSSLLKLLETNTTQAVRFSEMSFSISLDQASGGQKMGMSLKGEASNYNTVAFQSDVFTKNDNFKSPVFSDFNLNDKGVILFNVRADIDPKIILYKQGIIAVPPASVSNPPVATSTEAISTEATSTPQ